VDELSLAQLELNQTIRQNVLIVRRLRPIMSVLNVVLLFAACAVTNIRICKVFGVVVRVSIIIHQRQESLSERINTLHIRYIVISKWNKELSNE